MNESTPAAMPAPTSEPGISQPARIMSAFTAPSKAFSELHRNSSWWMAWLLMAIFSLGFVYTLDRNIGIEQITQNEIAKNAKAAERFEKLSPEQRERTLERAAKLSRIAYYAAPIISLVFYLIVGAVLMATFNFGMGAQVPFRVALAIAVYAFLPTVIGSLIGILSFGFVNPEGFNARNPVASNPAYFMDPTGHKFLYGLASGLDVFSLWTVVLLGIGFACQSKVKRSTAIGVVLGWFVLIKLAGAAWLAMS